MSTVLIVIMRWLHIIPAALAIGGLVFLRFILPGAIRGLPDGQREEVFLKARRGFKIVLHASILLLIISGTVNSIRFYPDYEQRRPLAFALWHTHMSLAVVVFIISFWSLAGKQAPPSHRTAGMVSFILLLVLVALASTLSWVRQNQKPASEFPARTQNK